MSTDVTLQTGFAVSTNIRDKLTTLEQSMLNGVADGSLEEQEVPLEEYSSDGCYARMIFIKKDTALVGAIHTDEWINIVSRGKIRIVTEEGTRVIDATERPQVFISPAGVKRAGFVLEDTWWMSFRASDATDDESARRKHTVSDYGELQLEVTK